MLLIIGNGFDLHSGLKSRYSDYFYYSHSDDRFKTFIQFIKEINEIEEMHLSVLWGHSKYDDLYLASNLKTDDLFNHITFWDILFIFRNYISKDKGWNYIEKVIQNFLKNSVQFIQTINSNIKITALSKYAPTKMSFEILIVFFLRKLNIDSIDLGFLFDQLVKLEDSFRHYLSFTISNSFKYEAIAQRTFEKLTKNHDSISIISFNYTNPPLKSFYSRSPIKIIRNVHGNLNNEIIFGIDQEGIDANSELFQFTKTSRILHSYHESNFSFPEKNHRRTIAFFGHSLSDMDYSYFQSIFDYYDIYSNTLVSLIFYYTNEAGPDEKFIVTNRVIRLLKKYGKHINKGTQGDNLLHKLFLENRIKITLIY